MNDLFTDKGAAFGIFRRNRYALWRIWDKEKPLIMFIGLNPSTANETENDPTITRVEGFARSWGYGGVYMLNCFSYISTDPKALRDDFVMDHQNKFWLKQIGAKCQEVVFAWGNFKVVKESGRDKILNEMFPNAKALVINKDGSPRHPLYVKGDTQLVKFNQK